MTIKKLIKSDRIETVDSRGGKRTKMPSTISLAVDHRFANEAQELLMDLKEGKTTETGLIGLELVAVYAEVEIDQDKAEEDLELDGSQGGGHES